MIRGSITNPTEDKILKGKLPGNVNYGIQGPSGPKGSDGGYYIQDVKQMDKNTIQFTFKPSKPDMPVVDPATVELPAGSGIDVSGAAPGQTVKIAAVDDKGRPTAWEPADFPESGGNVGLEGYATEQWVKDQKYLTEVPEGYAKDEDIPTKPEDIGAQPEGDYALRSEIPSVPVKSVNGKTGAVSLTATDVKARPDSWMPTASDVGALPKSTVIPTVPTKVSAFDNDAGYLTEHQDLSEYAKKTEIPSVPVKSVNGKTGAVSLTASDVKARPDTWTPSASDVGAMPNTTKIPSKTSDLTNDSGFITGYTETDPTVPAWAKKSTKPSYSKSEVGLGNVDNVKQYSASNPPPYPVTSVNGKTGSVTLDIPGSYTIPSFWQSALNTAIETVKSLQTGKNCVTFAHFSDNHVRLGYSGALIAEAMKQCHIPFCFYNGDSISSGYIATEAEMIAQEEAFKNMVSVIPNDLFCRGVGNHDGYWAVSASEKHTYTREQNYELFMRKQATAQNKQFGADGTYFYAEDLASKVRFIVLNTNGGSVDDAQLAWFRDVALKVDEGWAVVVISHQPISNHYHSGISNAAAVRSIVTESGVEMIGWFSGHTHRDRIYTGAATNTTDDTEGTAMGFKQITITSDHTGIAYEDATKHTVAEDNKSHAIDFVTINRDTKTVNLTRLGIGNNRVYSYDNVVLYSVTNNLTNAYSNSAISSVESGNAYTATLTVNSGYENLTVTVTMGGVDITSTAYSNGVINIASVTGDIVITATATKIEETVTYTNLADPASADWSNDDRLSSSGTNKGPGTNPGHVVTNWIECKQGDVIRIKGIDILDGTSGYAVIYTTAATATKCGNADIVGNFTTDENGVIYFTVATWVSTSVQPNITKMRFSGKLTAASANDVIITKNEPIV